MASIKADRRLYVTADRSQVVEEADAEAAFLLVAEGSNLYQGDVERYGLTFEDGRVRFEDRRVRWDDDDGPPPSGNEPDPEPEPEELEPTADEEVESAADGWPDGYTFDQQGAYFEVRAPDGEPVASETASGKWRGENAAQEAAWRHARGD